MKYETFEFDGHIAIDLEEGRFLIDSGSPTTFSRSGNITFAGKTVDVSTSVMGMLDADGLSSYVGTRLDGIVGMDLLSSHNVAFVPGWFYVDEAEIVDGAGRVIPESSFVLLATDDFMGIPVVDIEVGGRNVRAFVDTGAKISYLNTEMLSGVAVEETLHDFYPGIGEFDVEVSSLACSLNGWTLKTRFGRLPSLLQMTLMMGGVDGIIGHDLFARCAVRLGVGGRPVSFAPLGA